MRRLLPVLALFFVAACGRAPERRVLWVWERPEDLSAVDPRTTGVAILAASIRVDGGRVDSRRRLQPVRLPDGVETTAVFRIEANGPAPGIEAKVARVILDAVPASARGVQIDFDASESEREMYRRLLSALRARLPKAQGLSMTALASWCLDDPWIRDLPVDEAVPMLFRMGPDRKAVVDYLAGGGDFKVAVCRYSTGLSLDEPVYRLPRGRKLYFFSPERWTTERIAMTSHGRFLQ